MSIFQILASLFGLFMIYTVTLYSKKRTLSAVETSFWISVWGLFIVLAIFPNLLTGISDSLNFARVFDLLLVLALMVLSIITFVSYLRQKSLEDRIETFVRQMSIEQTAQQKSKSQAKKQRTRKN